jgi:hypothetical protein
MLKKNQLGGLSSDTHLSCPRWPGSEYEVVSVSGPLQSQPRDDDRNRPKHIDRNNATLSEHAVKRDVYSCGAISRWVCSQLACLSPMITPISRCHLSTEIKTDDVRNGILPSKLLSSQLGCGKLSAPATMLPFGYGVPLITSHSHRLL